MKYQARISMLALSAVLGAAGPASAQTAAANPTSEASVDLTEVIVTARRIEENLQDVPLSVQVFNQEELNNRNVVTLTDLATYTPSLTANTIYGPDNTNFAIRGFSGGGQTAPSVGVYFSDAIVPRGVDGNGVVGGSGAGPGAFFDLQNIQVLQGPQGTLFGYNTTGGSILFVPQKPTSEFGGYVEGSYGNYDMRRIQAAVNVPVNDNVRFRIGVDSQSRQGYLVNESGIGPSRFDDVNYTSVRAALVVDIAPNLENYTNAYFTKSDTNGSIPRLFACNPKASASSVIFLPLCTEQLTMQGSGFGFYNVENDDPQAASTLVEWQIVNTTTWHLSDQLTLKNIANYGQLHDDLYDNLFGSNFVVPPLALGLFPTGAAAGKPFQFVQVSPTPGLGVNEESTTSEELQAQGNALTGRLTYQAGLYFEINNPLGASGTQSPQLLGCTNAVELQCTDYFGNAVRNAIGAPINLGNLGRDYLSARRKDYAAYTQESYALTDQLKLNAGLRHTWDEAYTRLENAAYYFPQPNTPTLTCVGNPTVTVASPANCRQQFEVGSHAPTWLIDLDYKPIDNLLMYAKYSRGYREGSIVPIAPPGYNTTKPEKLDTYELGLKSNFRGPIPMTFNIAAFYNDYTNEQIGVNFANSKGAATPVSGLVNAGKSRIYGTEIEASITPFRGLRLDGNYTYLNARLISANSPPLSPAAGSLYDEVLPTAVAGSRETGVPEHKANVIATYVLPLPEGIGKVSAGLTYSYTDAMIVSLSNAPFSSLPPLSLLDLNLNWGSIGGRPLDLRIFVTNLTNKQYFSNLTDTYNTTSFEAGFAGPPRMFGAGLRARF